MTTNTLLGVLFLSLVLYCISGGATTLGIVILGFSLPYYAATIILIIRGML